MSRLDEADNHECGMELLPSMIRLCCLVLACRFAGLAGAARVPTSQPHEHHLVHAATGRPIRADYGFGEITVGAADLGLKNDAEILTMDLSTRFDEAIVQLALQGMCNRAKPRVWLDNHTVHWGHGEGRWKSYYTQAHGLRFRKIGRVADVLPKAIPKFNGVILYDQDGRTAQVFLAMNLANTNGCLPVSRRYFETHREIFRDTRVVERIARDEFSHEAINRWMLDRLVPKTNTGTCLSINRGRLGQDGTEHGAYQSIDYGFRRRCFIYSFAPNGDVVGAFDESCARQLMSMLHRPAIVMGWGENEWKMCHRVSMYGHTWCATVAAPSLW